LAAARKTSYSVIPAQAGIQLVITTPRSGQGRIYGVAPLLKLLVKQLAI